MSGFREAFSSSYAEARHKFVQAAADAGLAVEAKPHPLPGLHGETLAMDVARDGHPSASRLLILSSGCHGVEGYCGSGVQVAVLRDAAWRARAAEAAFAREVMASIVGAENVMAQEPTMGAEDFAYMLQAKPGAYCFIANGDGSHREMGHGAGPCMLHNPSYDFNDDLIPLGATCWVQIAEQFLAPGPEGAPS